VKLEGGCRKKKTREFDRTLAHKKTEWGKPKDLNKGTLTEK